MADLFEMTQKHQKMKCGRHNQREQMPKIADQDIREGALSGNDICTYLRKERRRERNMYPQRSQNIQEIDRKKGTTKNQMTGEEEKNPQQAST